MTDEGVASFHLAGADSNKSEGHGHTDFRRASTRTRVDMQAPKLFVQLHVFPAAGFIAGMPTLLVTPSLVVETCSKVQIHALTCAQASTVSLLKMNPYISAGLSNKEKASACTQVMEK